MIRAANSISDFLTVGGPVVWTLMGMSVAALSIIILKLWQFARARPESCADVDRAIALYRAGQQDEAIFSLDMRRPVSELVSIAMRGQKQETPQGLLREEIERIAAKRLDALRSYLRGLEIISGLAPLLGLLGTVLGMIAAFKAMENAGDQVDPAVLSGGIWQALLTTAVGLGVAIPVSAVNGWMERKVERVALRMNDAVTQVFTGQINLAPTPGLLQPGTQKDAQDAA